MRKLLSVILMISIILGNTMPVMATSLSLSKNEIEKETVLVGTELQEVLSEEESVVSNNSMQNSTVSENAVSDNDIQSTAVSGNNVSDNSIQSTAVSENTISKNNVPSTTVSDNAISENNVQNVAVSENTIRDNSIQNSTVSENTVSDNSLQNADDTEAMISVSGGDILLEKKQITENVRLYSCDEREGDYVWECSFETLQDAFLEINRIAVSDRYYYVQIVNDTKGIVTYTDKNLTFPSKAKEVIVEGGSVYMKDNLTLKCNTTFINSILAPTKEATLSMGKFELLLEDCFVGDEDTAVGFKKITGSGVTGPSKLTLDNTSLTVNGEISGIGTLVYADTREDSMSVYDLRRGVPIYPTLIANGKIGIGNIELQTDGYLTGYATVKRSKEKEITAVTPQITISGQVTSTDNNHTLYLDLQEVVSKRYVGLAFDNSDMANMHALGIKLAKADNVTYPNIKAVQCADSVLLKSGGYLTYFEGGHGVELSYQNGDEQNVIVPCRSFSDAVTEINSKKAKRDYTITILEANTDISGANQNGSKEVPKALNMPNKNYIETLTIQSDTEGEQAVIMGFLGNITLTSDVILQDVTFVQMIKSGSDYKKADELKDDYPSAATFNVAGYDLTIKGNNTFNTPLILKGGNKGSITFDTRGTITTLTNDYDRKASLNDEIIENVIYGSITGFKEVNVEGCNLTLKEFASARNSKKFTASNNNMTNLNIKEDGKGTGVVTVIGQSAKGSLNVTTLNNNNGKILVEGKVQLRDVLMEGEQQPAIAADLNFNITGKYTNNSDGTVLITRRKGAGKAPYLNVSGIVERVADTGPVTIKVLPESTAVVDRENPVRLLPEGSTSAVLLSAKNAQARDFKPHADNYAGGEYDSTNTSGYMMFKSGSNISVYDGECVTVAVYKGETIAEKTLVGYYPAVKDATSHVNSLKKASQDYTYVLMTQNDSVSSSVVITIPSYAGRIVITRLDSANIPQKTMNIRGNITGKAKQTVVLDIDGLEVAGNISGMGKLVIKDNATINGSLKVTDLQLENVTGSDDNIEPVTLSVKGAVTVEEIHNYGNKQNVLEFTRTTKDVSNLTVNKLIENEDALLLLRQNDEGAVTALEKTGLQAVLSNGKKFAAMPRASTDSFVAEAKVKTVQGNVVYNSAGNQTFRLIKANKGIYLAGSTLEENMVTLMRKNAVGTVTVTNCLDYAQAINEINTIGDVTSDYEIELHTYNGADNSIDTVVTDKNTYGPLALPGANKKNTLLIKNVNEDEKAKMIFTGNISGYGNVTVQDVELAPVKSGSNNTPVDTTIKIASDNTSKTPMLTLKNVSTKTTVADTAQTKGFITSITGTKNKTDVILENCGNLILKTGISNVDEVTLKGTKLFTAGASAVNTIRMENEQELPVISSWDSLGKLTVKDIYMPIELHNSYIGVMQDKNEKPQFVLNNEVQQGTLLCKVYVKNTKITDADEIMGTALNAKANKEVEKYCGTLLVSAKNASAHKIRAYAFRDANAEGSIVENAEQITKDNLISYKLGVYVVNENKANMTAQITKE